MVELALPGQRPVPGLQPVQQILQLRLYDGMSVALDALLDCPPDIIVAVLSDVPLRVSVFESQAAGDLIFREDFLHCPSRAMRVRSN